jgi:uncharacterized SAM-binding protein YcdF (DUF218 family)
MIELQIALKGLLLPPGILILVALVGLMKRREVIGKLLVVLALSSLWVLSLPYFADRLLAAQETIPPVNEAAIKAFQPQAIVVLGGGTYRGNTEYGGDTVGPSLLARLRYAAWLGKRTGLPIIPTGGSEAGRIPEAVLAREVLQEEFGSSVPLIEQRSRTTWQNAQLTAELAQPHGIQRILLVTHSWHMPRAAKIFRQAGFEVLPAPTLFDWPDPNPGLLDWIPDAGALEKSRTALHEILGRAFYDLRAWSKGSDPCREVRETLE